VQEAANQQAKSKPLPRRIPVEGSTARAERRALTAAGRARTIRPTRASPCDPPPDL